MNNYSELYNTAFRVNAASIIMYKSSRKNAKCSDIISINHLINNKTDRKIPDDRILEQFINIVEKVVYTAAGFNNHIELTVNLDSAKNSQYKNVNGETYKTWESNYYTWYRVKCSSVESCINFLYKVFYLIYPYNELNLENTIYNNPSIKYLIKKYYNK